jgi:hypothetical protein
MGETHDYDTAPVAVADLDSSHVLVGESGGLSAVYGTEPSNIMVGCHVVRTEHGSLYLDTDAHVDVLA